MSEREFELYLSLLGGMLQLNSQQRQEISEELQSHLDERLDDLLASGLSREDAVRACLEEFGDAAGLAAHFTQLSSLKRRRRIMRWTTGTVTVMTAAILTLAYFWPAEQNGLPIVVSSPVIAQVNQPAMSSAPPKGQNAPAPTQDPNIERIEKKFNQPLDQISFLETPFSDVLKYLSDTLEVDIIVDRMAFEDSGLDVTQPVTLELTYGKVTASTLLELFFEQLGVADLLTYTVRDEIVYLTRISNSMSIRVYDCRDLIAPQVGAMGMMGSMDMEGDSSGEMMMGAGMAPGMATPVQFGGGMGSGLGGGGGSFGGGDMGEMYEPAPSPGRRLIEVIQYTVAPNMWTDQGGDGSIEELNGLLVIKTTEDIHRQVTDLIDQMRTVKKGNAPAANY